MHIIGNVQTISLQLQLLPSKSANVLRYKETISSFYYQSVLIPVCGLGQLKQQSL